MILQKTQTDFSNRSNTTININGKNFVVNVLLLPKKHSSANIKDNQIVIRLSSKLSKNLQKEHIENLFQKMLKLLKKKEIKEQRTYMDGDIIEICNGKRYMLHVKKSKQKEYSGKLISENAIEIKSPKNLESENYIQIQAWLRKLLAKDNQAWLEDYIAEVNEKYFNFQYKKVALKNFKRRFGHCTTRNEIAICSRLLFVSIDLLEYVVIHELAHIKEKNHGKKFWNLVNQACHDHKEKRKFLKNFDF